MSEPPLELVVNWLRALRLMILDVLSRLKNVSPKAEKDTSVFVILIINRLNNIANSLNNVLKLLGINPDEKLESPENQLGEIAVGLLRGFTSIAEEILNRGVLSVERVVSSLEEMLHRIEMVMVGSRALSLLVQSLQEKNRAILKVAFDDVLDDWSIIAKRFRELNEVCITMGVIRGR